MNIRPDSAFDGWNSSKRIKRMKERRDKWVKERDKYTSESVKKQIDDLIREFDKRISSLEEAHKAKFCKKKW